MQKQKFQNPLTTKLMYYPHFKQSTAAICNGVSPRE